MNASFKNLIGVAALAGLVSMAGAAEGTEPLRLTDPQLDTASAGFNVDARFRIFRFQAEGASVGAFVGSTTLAQDLSIYQGGSVVRGAVGLSTGGIIGQVVGNGASSASAAARLRVNITAPN